MGDRKYTRVTRISQIQRGDHITIWYNFYYHHAIVEEVTGRYINVIHRNSFGVRRHVYNFSQHSASYSFYIVNHRNRLYNREETLKRAKIRLNENGYHLNYNNCEHLAEWCVNDREISYQIRNNIVYGALSYVLNPVAHKKH